MSNPTTGFMLYCLSGGGKVPGPPPLAEPPVLQDLETQEETEELESQDGPAAPPVIPQNDGAGAVSFELKCRHCCKPHTQHHQAIRLHIGDDSAVEAGDAPAAADVTPPAMISSQTEASDAREGGDCSSWFCLDDQEFQKLVDQFSKDSDDCMHEGLPVQSTSDPCKLGVVAEKKEKWQRKVTSEHRDGTPDGSYAHVIDYRVMWEDGTESASLKRWDIAAKIDRLSFEPCMHALPGEGDYNCQVCEVRLCYPCFLLRPFLTKQYPLRLNLKVSKEGARFSIRSEFLRS